ncbi:hypothetical protein BpHYR1_015128 [Brachionus plicatilis]|uniref:Uncharacterized protein n=1 Tax=Brachionus plicatilis TaxID=10195 RepID=A0A3M7S9U7_BRAPC|nr:hypothetical protein BpHYR1_015128 [Brachionus plicatilis]
MEKMKLLLLKYNACVKTRGAHANNYYLNHFFINHKQYIKSQTKEEEITNHLTRQHVETPEENRQEEKIFNLSINQLKNPSSLEKGPNVIAGAGDADLQLLLLDCLLGIDLLEKIPYFSKPIEQFDKL